ncbi:MAG: hypothetical protein OEL69_02225 [Nitrosopumilus sp.]|nr:hypothetical protein [Nitrosopumilus sp.]
MARCTQCNYVARYNSKFFTIQGLQRHPISLPTESDYCNHSMMYSEEREELNR